VFLVDTHCHLHLLEGRPEAVRVQAAAEGVGHLIDVGIDLASSADAATNAARLEGVSATAGIHPHNAIELTGTVTQRLERLLALEHVVGVGETGLDYFRDHSPRRDQRAAFGMHVRLAREHGKALVVHCRDAFDDLMDMLASEGALPGKVVLHCFSGDAEMAAGAVAAGYVLSFAGNVTFKNAPALREACAQVPLDRIVLETDSPFLAPHPHRGTTNRPGRVSVTAATVAEVHGTSVEEVARATTATAARVFGLSLDGSAGE
jgi:TatD DNase family protein